MSAPEIPNAPRPLAVEWLGTVAYDEALALQAAALEARRAGETGDRLLLLEHPPVITLGRSARPENLLEPREQLAARGIEVHEVARGGDVTYHAPGQLVGYLIADIRERGEPDVHRFLRDLEGALIDALAMLGVAARRIDGMTGVFVDRVRSAAPRGARERKIASIGVGLRRWVTYHGFALNVDLDLAGFASIVPCGLSQVEMTSVAKECPGGTPELTARTPGDDEADWMTCTRAAVERAFGRWFDDPLAVRQK